MWRPRNGLLLMRRPSSRSLGEVKAACVYKERYFPHSTMWGHSNAGNRAMDSSAVKDNARSLPTVLVVCKPMQLHGSRKGCAELHNDRKQCVSQRVGYGKIVRVFVPPEVNL